MYAVCAPYILNSGMGLLGGLNMPVGNDAKGAGPNRGRRAEELVTFELIPDDDAGTRSRALAPRQREISRSS